MCKDEMFTKMPFWVLRKLEEPFRTPLWNPLRFFFISKGFTEALTIKDKVWTVSWSWKTKSGEADFSTSTPDDTLDLPSSKKTVEYTLHWSVGIYPVVAKKSVKQWNLGKPGCTELNSASVGNEFLAKKGQLLRGSGFQVHSC